MSGAAWLDERYGRRPPGRRRRTLLVTALAVVAVAALAWAVWAVAGLSRAAVSVGEVRVDASDPGLVRVSFEVIVPSGRPAVCAVRATDAAGGVVGWTDVRVVPGGSGATTAEVAVRTSLPATGGGVRDCIAR
jgi:Domain of unknown function (DUF4307)